MISSVQVALYLYARSRGATSDAARELVTTVAQRYTNQVITWENLEEVAALIDEQNAI